MAKLSIDDLKKIRENVSKDTSIRHGDFNIQVTVHMGTCGIAAGAREVMHVLMEEITKSQKDDIRVVTSGCLGICSSEPNITVEIKGEKQIVYKDLDKNKMRQIFKRHILNGEVQTDFALAKS